MSRKASTAALETSASRLRPNQRRAPRHPASEKGTSEFKAQRTKNNTTKFHSGQTAILPEDSMNGTNQISNPIRHKTILPVILRITFSLILCTFGFASMNLTEAQTRPQRIIRSYPVDRARLEHLQRWVNEGHDTWCRDPKLVASAVLSRIGPGVAGSGFELASLPTERKSAHGSAFIYSLSTLDGHVTYNVTLRRFRWLLPIAGTTDQMVWAPVRIETITHPATD